jgi:hypothetical protein
MLPNCPSIGARALVRRMRWVVPLRQGCPIESLALGETTAGPLIGVVPFVGFVVGWTKAMFGPDAIVASAVAASIVVTFFMFPPSSLFILLGGPFIETTHGNLKFTAPLTAITSAVVGVIVSLAVFFAPSRVVDTWHARRIRMALAADRCGCRYRTVPAQGRGNTGGADMWFIGLAQRLFAF